jgi:murein DD-endopeptidase MepM/ murein hydrolase activator NlpD
MIVEPVSCPACGEKYDPLRARAITVVNGRVRAFCSQSCKERGEVAVALTNTGGGPQEGGVAAPRDSGWSLRSAAAVAMALALGFGGKFLDRGPRPIVTAALTPPVAQAFTSKAPSMADDALRLLGARKAVGAVALDERDVWLHPLPGPERRFPIRNSRRFGAPREGMRPEECRSGHCGVDLGDHKGELVVASHDGVIERVVRVDDGSKEGRFVRIAHRGGLVVTSYMHLDRIRETLEPGTSIKAGEVVGTIGDSGVQHSGPHLHFAVSVRSAPDGPELFIDPEPLLHLWPLRAPLEDNPFLAPRRARTASAKPESPPRGG